MQKIVIYKDSLILAVIRTLIVVIMMYFHDFLTVKNLGGWRNLRLLQCLMNFFFQNFLDKPILVFAIGICFPGKNLL